MGKFCANAPCVKCPFRIDRPGYLTAARAQEIADGLRNDMSFYCHETVDYHDDDEDGEGTIGPNTRECAGAVIVIEKEGFANQMMRIAERIGIYDRNKMRMNAPVAESLDDFIEHHSREERRGKKRSAGSRKKKAVG